MRDLVKFFDKEFAHSRRVKPDENILSAEEGLKSFPQTKTFDDRKKSVQ